VSTKLINARAPIVTSCLHCDWSPRPC